jgi:hypothetical protein
VTRKRSKTVSLSVAVEVVDLQYYNIYIRTVSPL